MRGAPQVHTLGGRPVFLLPLFHPAAALRTPSLAEVLRQDFRTLPELLSRQPPAPGRTASDPDGAEGLAGPPAEAEAEADQLGLFG